MDPRSVLVSYALKSSESPYSCSATMISDDWVLAHGTLLEPLIARTDGPGCIVDELKAGVLVTNERIKSPDFSIISEIRTPRSSRPPCCGARVLPNVNNCADDAGPEQSYEIKKARLAAAWKCPLLTELYESILSSWRFSESSGSCSLAAADKKLFPLLLLLRIERARDTSRSSRTSTPRDALGSLAKILVAPRRGQEAEICSTPFGNPVFMNSVTSGLVSNVLGPSRSLLLTDASAVIGCEGAPIFVKYKSEHRAMCGLVIAPLSWCRGEWVGYTLGLSLLPCLQRLLDLPDKRNDLAAGIPASEVAERVDKSVVVVKCGSGWGSGVLVDKPTGTILTCSHVVKEAPSSKITVQSQQFSAKADLIYRTPDDKSYDLAVIRVDPREVAELESLAMVGAPVRKGDRVICAGFPLVPSTDEPLLLPTITRGSVSHVSPGMIQTTCCIQSGTSGGPIAAAHPSGGVLGVIVCNATAAGNNALFPRVNMAVPAAVFKRPIEDYLRTQDVKFLRALENKDDRIQQTWNLNITPSARL